MSSFGTAAQALIGPEKLSGVAERAHLVRAMGARAAWQRLRQESRYEGLGSRVSGEVYRRIWEEAAASVDGRVVELPGGFLEIRNAESAVRVWRRMVPLDDGVALRLAMDKPASEALLRGAGIPTPSSVEVAAGDTNAARRFLAEHDVCVVKPARGEGGAGVTTGVRTPEDLSRALRRAGRIDRRLVLEREVPGSVHRILVLDGEILDVVRRDPPRVVGDGRSTIGDLVAAENEARMNAGGRLGLTLLTVDLDCIGTLGARGLDLRSVPRPGQVVEVKRVTNQSGAKDTHRIVDPLLPRLADDARAAAATLGLRLAGVDLVAPDLRHPLDVSGGAVIEVNGGPGLHYHYLTSGEHAEVLVAIPILRRALAEGARPCEP